MNLDWLVFQFSVLLYLRYLFTAFHVRTLMVSLRPSCSGKLVNFYVVICLLSQYRPNLTTCLYVCLSLMTCIFSDEEESGSENDHVNNMAIESDEEQNVGALVATCILCQGQLRYGDLYYSTLRYFV